MELPAEGPGPPQGRKGGLAGLAPQVFWRPDSPGWERVPSCPSSQWTWITLRLSALLQPCIQPKNPLAPFTACFSGEQRAQPGDFGGRAPLSRLSPAVRRPSLCSSPPRQPQSGHHYNSHVQVEKTEVQRGGRTGQSHQVWPGPQTHVKVTPKLDHNIQDCP